MRTGCIGASSTCCIASIGWKGPQPSQEAKARHQASPLLPRCTAATPSCAFAVTSGISRVFFFYPLFTLCNNIRWPLAKDATAKPRRCCTDLAQFSSEPVQPMPQPVAFLNQQYLSSYSAGQLATQVLAQQLFHSASLDVMSELCSGF